MRHRSRVLPSLPKLRPSSNVVGMPIMLRAPRPSSHERDRSGARASCQVSLHSQQSAATRRTWPTLRRARSGAGIYGCALFPSPPAIGCRRRRAFSPRTARLDHALDSWARGVGGARAGNQLMLSKSHDFYAPCFLQTSRSHFPTATVSATLITGTRRHALFSYSEVTSSAIRDPSSWKNTLMYAGFFFVPSLIP